MNQLIPAQPIVYKNQRILTSDQLAEFYQCDKKMLRQNFNNNKDQYQENVDFFIVPYEEIRSSKISTPSSNRSPMYVWTESGALLHAKSLNTEKAWQVYKHLVDTYFRFIEIKNELSSLDSLNTDNLLNLLKISVNRLEEVHNENKTLTKQIEQDKPKIEFYDKFVSSEGNILIRQLAKMIDKNLGERDLFDFLKTNKIIISHNEPYQRYNELGWFAMKLGKHNENSKLKTHYTLTVTPKGQTAIYNLFCKKNQILLPTI